MVDSTDHVTGKTGLTLTITASKDGAAFASITPTVTELANGWYNLALTSTHTDTVGALALHIISTGADPTDIADEVVADLPGASVSSVTGNVGGNVAGSVASVTAGVTVSTNNDKTGYSISGTKTTLDALNDIAAGAAMTLTSAYDFAKGTTAMTEAYSTKGGTVTPAQALHEILALLQEKAASSTTLTVKKRDGTTSAMTFTLDDATNPSSITRAT